MAHLDTLAGPDILSESVEDLLNTLMDTSIENASLDNICELADTETHSMILGEVPGNSNIKSLSDSVLPDKQNLENSKHNVDVPVSMFYNSKQPMHIEVHQARVDKKPIAEKKSNCSKAEKFDKRMDDNNNCTTEPVGNSNEIIVVITEDTSGYVHLKYHVFPAKLEFESLYDVYWCFVFAVMFHYIYRKDKGLKISTEDSETNTHNGKCRAAESDLAVPSDSPSQEKLQ